jgi:hypothetical protein
MLKDHELTGTDTTGGKPSFNLRHAFEAKSEQLASTMGAASKMTVHGPTIGDASEAGWRNMLEGFLPKRYAVKKAFVVDSQGNQSQQLDLVVHDRHFTPIFWEIDNAVFLPAESVYAVFEVKQDLNLGYLREAGEKVASVRRLHRTSQRIVHAGGEVMQPKPPPSILGGLLAGRSSWSPAFGQPLRDGLDGLEADQRLDLGCGLTDGAFELPANATASTGLVTADANVGLAYFAMRLMARLQRMGTVPALDIDAYTAVLSD